MPAKHRIRRDTDDEHDDDHDEDYRGKGVSSHFRAKQDEEGYDDDCDPQVARMRGDDDD